MKPALIIFQKNLVEGKVKTRLAKTMGNAAALKIYTDLVDRTVHMCRLLENEVDLHVFYSSKLEAQDAWSVLNCKKHVQIQADDLGERMKEAFERVKQIGYRQLCIIGTDCPYLSADHLRNVFKYLHTHKIVLGPAKDGGFYLLGIQSLDALDFGNVRWSTSTVLDCYLKNLQALQLAVKLLEVLEDVDDETSYKNFIGS